MSEAELYLVAVFKDTKERDKAIDRAEVILNQLVKAVEEMTITQPATQPKLQGQERLEQFQKALKDFPLFRIFLFHNKLHLQTGLQIDQNFSSNYDLTEDYHITRYGAKTIALSDMVWSGSSWNLIARMFYLLGALKCAYVERDDVEMFDWLLHVVEEEGEIEYRDFETNLSKEFLNNKPKPMEEEELERILKPIIIAEKLKPEQE